MECTKERYDKITEVALTLPLDLCLQQSDLPERGYEVRSIKDIPMGVKFGPCDETVFKCSFKQDLKNDSEWQVEGINNDMILEERNEKRSSWLSYVNYAHKEKHANMIILHSVSGAYYITNKLIPANTALVVYDQDNNVEERKDSMSAAEEISNFNLMVISYAEQCAKVGERLPVVEDLLLTEEKVRNIYKLIQLEEREQRKKYQPQMIELLKDLQVRIQSSNYTPGMKYKLPDSMISEDWEEWLVNFKNAFEGFRISKLESCFRAYNVSYLLSDLFRRYQLKRWSGSITESWSNWFKNFTSQNGITLGLTTERRLRKFYKDISKYQLLLYAGMSFNELLTLLPRFLIALTAYPEYEPLFTQG